MKKADTPSYIYKTEFDIFKESHDNYNFIYTDGSKTSEFTSSAIVCNDKQYGERIPSNASIFTAELHAIYLALLEIENSQKINFVIASDSLSSLLAISNPYSTNPLVQRILLKHHSLISELNKQIIFLWIPGHSNIIGNEKADTEAKTVPSDNECRLRLPYSDYKPLFKAKGIEKWQISWDSQYLNKQWEIQKSVENGVCPRMINRRDQVVLNRLRIGHSYVTHNYLLKSEDPPFCYACDQNFTIKHILIECSDFLQIRSKYYRANDLQDLFQNINISLIFAFLKEIGLYYKI